LTPTENIIVEIQNAERRCIRSEAAVDDLKEQLKEAKARHEMNVNQLRSLARAANLDSHRPLLAAANAVNAEASAAAASPDAGDAEEQFDNDDLFDEENIVALASDSTNEFLSPPLEEGEIRIKLLSEITEGEDVWPAGAELVVRVDDDGATLIPTPTKDDPNDGVYLEAEEFEVLEIYRVPTPAKATSPASDDSRLDTPLADTPIPKSLVEKLNDHGIRTVRELANFTSANQLTDIKGVGQGKAEKIEVAMVEFWAAK
jgi:hypothetical protein